jgi:primary-amine oxidase
MQPKAELAPFLEAERSGKTALRPAREADLLFFELATRTLVRSVINLDSDIEVSADTIDDHHAPLDRDELNEAKAALLEDPLYLKTIQDFAIPGATIVPQGWPFGSDHPDKAIRRIFYILYHRNPENDHPDSNHYAYPLPIVLFWDVWEKKVISVEHCYTGSEEDGFVLGTGEKVWPTKGCKGGEYLPSLRDQPMREDLRPLHVTQPEGVSFQVTGQLIEWQKWRFRLSFK